MGYSPGARLWPGNHEGKRAREGGKGALPRLPSHASTPPPFASLPSMEKMKSLAVWISSALWSSYSRWSCFVNSWMSLFNSSTRAPDLKSSSGNVGLLLQPREAALLAVGAAIFMQNAPSSSSAAAAAPTPAPHPAPWASSPRRLRGCGRDRGRAGGRAPRRAVPAPCAPGVPASEGARLQRECACGPDTLSCAPRRPWSCRSWPAPGPRWQRRPRPERQPSLPRGEESEVETM